MPMPHCDLLSLWVLSQQQATPKEDLLIQNLCVVGRMHASPPGTASGGWGGGG